MDKKIFMNRIPYEDKIMISNLYDKLILAEKIYGKIYSNDFYPPLIWDAVVNLGQEFDMYIQSYGIFEDAERKMLGFSKTEIENLEYPIDLLKIQNLSSFVSLKHKDYLGALMALGIKREKFGDLVTEADCAYLAVSRDIVPYVIENLISVGKCPCSITIEDVFAEKIPKYSFKEIFINISSLRLDDVVGALSNVSRSKAVEMIKSGKVKVNYVQVFEKAEAVKSNTVITIQGVGKHKISENFNFTQKGRMKIAVKKYV